MKNSSYPDGSIYTDETVCLCTTYYNIKQYRKSNREIYNKTIAEIIYLTAFVLLRD